MKCFTTTYKQYLNNKIQNNFTYPIEYNLKEAIKSIINNNHNSTQPDLFLYIQSAATRKLGI